MRVESVSESMSGMDAGQPFARGWGDAATREAAGGRDER